MAAPPGLDESLLQTISGPRDLRLLPAAHLGALAREIREFLIAKVMARGGHLGSNLGMVEITIALHRVFHSPEDTLLFDTGHQAYVHKLLTGRRADFDSLRAHGGLSGYPSREESPHDHIDNSHASTALAYADGIAKARRLKGEESRAVVAVVGDGALTGGLAWESLNNLSDGESRPVVIVLNDNGRSYAPTHGGCARNLGTLLENLGFVYLGPVDGHDIAAVERALRTARTLPSPSVVHCKTRKGYGYRPAELDLGEHMHAIPASDPRTGKPLSAGGQTWTHVFSERLCALGEARPDLVAITAAMAGPTGLEAFGRRFPGRMFDVGIAEQHAMVSAAGLALEGFHPVVAVYATFLNRAFDQVLLDVAMQRLPITIVLDRAGITGPDGPSHHGMWDLAILSAVPGLRVAAPRDVRRLRELLDEAVAVDGPTALRFPKAGAGAELAAVERSEGLDVLWSTGDDVLLVAVGATAEACVEAAATLAAEGVGVRVVDPRWVLPVAPGLVGAAAAHHLVVTVEDGVVTGGVGAAIAQACAGGTRVRQLGLPPAFIPHGSRERLLADAGLTGSGIAHAVRKELAR
ncbi:1-deoxy-D-xylulose-5-phosphate synthase [Nonomuraea endophytica]|uniref:1-deoxy-D-xylulose-5-phosphate synthase n=1 Tax=Nonomuraea endophytica TaxID=714136 RepID=A0A7W8A5V2_9ACTN|nr:1-deoxy-D-xylulose-5-phosphate synthase [Nonomuraea endophytica]MBB5080113.1 1-deoxy-D-xylulose-5-phosphate synthase [Nonomuraea endophytica]